MLYRVCVKEVHNQYIWIDADSVDEAVRKVQEGEGDELGVAEYDYTLDTEQWTVEQETDKGIIDDYEKSI